ncbi:MAG: hypothetical protein KAI26_08360 [Nanoarchaeota archaeon]|nr:hypothetical protein [Nanoarchaeota archaeon]
MAEVSTLRESLEFFDRIGIYDVILPFLLVFTIVYAILEKTKVFGMEKVGDKTVTKKNLNSMAAFVISFLVVASSQLVEVITQVSSHMVILLMLSVMFLILVGSFYKEGEGVFLEKGWKTLFMVIMFIGIVLIFLQAIKTDSGDSWLEYAFDYMSDNWSSTGVASIFLILFTVGIMYWLTKGEDTTKVKKEEE